MDTALPMMVSKANLVQGLTLETPGKNLPPIFIDGKNDLNIPDR